MFEAADLSCRDPFLERGCLIAASNSDYGDIVSK